MICQVCGTEDDDMRHVSVECFYDMSEISPKIKSDVVLSEVDDCTRYLSKAVKYKEEHERHWNIMTGDSNRFESVFKPTERKEVQFIKKSLFRINCCKDCRSHFLYLYEAWLNGTRIREF